MDAERVREFVLKLPLVEETTQWGDNLVFWVGDKAVGGKMFALVNLEADGRAVMSFSAGPERYHELVENDGIVPAPYMAHLYWVAIERWNALPARELQELLRAARDLTYEKLPKRTKAVLALPAAELRALVAERRKLLAERAKDESEAKAAKKTAAKGPVKSAKGKRTQPGELSLPPFRKRGGRMGHPGVVESGRRGRGGDPPGSADPPQANGGLE